MESLPSQIVVDNPTVESTQMPSSSNKKFVLFVIGLIVLNILGLLVFYFFFFIPKYTQLPIPISNPNLENSRILYTFNGKLLSKEDRSDYWLLKTDISGKGVPEFLIKKTMTRIIFVDLAGVGEMQVNESILNPGAKIQISALYDLKQKQWLFPTIRVIKTKDEPKTLPSIRPQATPESSSSSKTNL
jgi:hypothetical protein